MTGGRWRFTQNENSIESKDHKINDFGKKEMP